MSCKILRNLKTTHNKIPPFNLKRLSSFVICFYNSGCAHALRTSALEVGSSRLDFILGDGTHVVAPQLLRYYTNGSVKPDKIG